ncbi:MAG: LytTR family DNA-binding domain-containing protein [Ignavibacteria bacterium]|nr:LytTR family DNA-binding domain-containing protein [Ignavibacteria bacterium]
MMNIRTVIIEDEKSNANRLIRLLGQLRPDYIVLSVLESIEDTISWVVNNPPPDVFFMDVQLSDGLCFEIFQKVEIEVPIIFTTAFDEFAINAFKVNSVDYLLKPLDRVDLESALLKFEKLHLSPAQNQLTELGNFLKSLRGEKNSFKNRFLVKHKNAQISISTDETAYFMLKSSLLYLFTFDKRKYLLESYLEDLEKTLNPDQFFRINRQCIVQVNSVKMILEYPGSRLKLLLEPPFEQDVIVSREKVSQFKAWMGR